MPEARADPEWAEAVAAALVTSAFGVGVGVLAYLAAPPVQQYAEPALRLLGRLLA